jgi:hypothetical protein
MTRPAIVSLLALLALLSAVGLTWGGMHALLESKDLLYRRAEVARFLARQDPYTLDSMTYPPSALPVFTPLVAPFRTESALKAAWLALNLAILAVLCGTTVRLWGRTWPLWVQVAFVLAVSASKPVRGGIGNGQFHLIPTALMVLAVAALRVKRPVVAGLLVGVALAKPTMVLPFLALFAARKQWTALGTAVGFQALATLGVSAWLGIGPVTLLREWGTNARSQLAEGLIDLPTLAQTYGAASPRAASLLTPIVLVVTLMVALAYRSRSDLALTSFCAFMAAIGAYHRPYDLVLLVPPFALFVDAACAARGRLAAVKIAAAVGFALLLIAPSHGAVAGGLERWYNLTFALFAYAFLALGIHDLARGREPTEPRLA